jgi:hypothetical protein
VPAVDHPHIKFPPSDVILFRPTPTHAADQCFRVELGDLVTTLGRALSAGDDLRLGGGQNLGLGRSIRLGLGLDFALGLEPCLGFLLGGNTPGTC